MPAGYADDSLTKKRASVAMQHQREVDKLLIYGDTYDVDWDELRNYMWMEGVKVNHLDSGTLVSTLHRCAYAGQRDIANWCIKSKADINGKTALGRTPLHYAVDGNRSNVIGLLLEEKADVNEHALSGSTPLHLACRNNSYDAVLTLLGDREQIVDIDFEDQQRQMPEKLTQNKMILKSLRNYRHGMDKMRKKMLLDVSLKRIFKLFDQNGDGYIRPEEWVDTQSFIAEGWSEQCNEEEIQKAFDEADENSDGKIDITEFMNSHKGLLAVLNASYKDMMRRLTDLEDRIFEEHIRILKEGRPQDKNQPEAEEGTDPVPFEDVEKVVPEHPVVTPRAKALSKKRTLKALTTRAELK